MKIVTRISVAVSLLLGLSHPLSARAADQDLQQKIDGLTQEVEALKQDVSLTKKKSLGQWLTIGGDYRVRFDSLRGDTAAFVDVNKTFANAQNTITLNVLTGAPNPPAP